MRASGRNTGSRLLVVRRPETWPCAERIAPLIVASNHSTMVYARAHCHRYRSSQPGGEYTAAIRGFRADSQPDGEARNVAGKAWCHLTASPRARRRFRGGTGQSRHEPATLFSESVL